MTSTLIEQARPSGPPEPQRRRSSAGDVAVASASHFVLVLWSAIVIVPLLWVLMSSVKTTDAILSRPLALPTSLNFDNYANAWKTAGIGKWFFNTVIVVGFALVIVMILGAMCAYVLARYQFWGNRLIYYTMLAGLTFPVFMAIVPLFFILKNIGLLNTLPGLDPDLCRVRPAVHRVLPLLVLPDAAERDL